MSPYPIWMIGSGDTAWQLTAGTLVGLMSIPALAVLYGGLVQKKWTMNTMMMVFVTFCLVLITWVLWAYKMGFGTPLIGQFVGDPRTVLGANALTGQAGIPNLNNSAACRRSRVAATSTSRVPPLCTSSSCSRRSPRSCSSASVLGRISFKVWVIFVPLWITFAYAVNAFMLWGGGYWAGKGALDFSGGYVIHLAAGVSGFTAAAIVGPRLKKDREKAIPSNLMMVAVGAGILWLGWNGFNGGDPYFASTDAAAAVVNTNLATAVAMMVWIFMDWFFSKEKKPTFLGGLNGMICGLVGITPAAGYVNGLGAIIIGVVCPAVVWVAWYTLPKYVWPFNKVDDALGVVYTHGIAGLLGGLLVGCLADPNMIEYFGPKGTAAGGSAGAGAFYGDPHRLLIQFLAALTIIVWDAFVTAAILFFIKYVLRLNLRAPEAILEIGDIAIHGEEAFPEMAFLSATAEAEASPSTQQPIASVFSRGVTLRHVAAVA